MGAAKAWVAAASTQATVVIMYLLGQLDAVKAMPDDVRGALSGLVMLTLGGICGLVVYIVPNKSAEPTPVVITEPDPAKETP